MQHPSVLEIDVSALKQNYRFIRRLVGKQRVISSVIKGNAYGHGIESFVPIAQACGQNHFSVSGADEAYRAERALREPGVIVIMGMIGTDEIAWAIRKGVEFYVFDQPRLEAAVRIARRLKRKARIHVEVETGLNRTGFDRGELPRVFETLNQHADQLELKGLCTHFAGAESIANYYRVTHQLRRFQGIARQFGQAGLRPERLHTACSAAAIRFPAARMDLVRIGIMQYGYWPNTETMIGHMTRARTPISPLQRVITWKSRIMSTKEVKAGEFIGYGTLYLATTAMRIAVIPVGYAHGFSRSLSNQGRVLLNGNRAAVIGAVNMNCFAIDVTNLPETRPGDEVILIGDQGELSITVASFSEMSNQMNYELLTRLPKEIPRIIKADG
jgi:alanine racemase